MDGIIYDIHASTMAADYVVITSSVDLQGVESMALPPACERTHVPTLAAALVVYGLGILVGRFLRPKRGE